MTAGGRPPGARDDRDPSASLRQALLVHEEDQSLRATRSGRAQDIASIRRLSAGGMSRKRLQEIYGRDVVDLALAG